MEHQLTEFLYLTSCGATREYALSASGLQLFEFGAMLTDPAFKRQYTSAKLVGEDIRAQRAKAKR